jgi:PPM family protein phosphatase
MITRALGVWDTVEPELGTHSARSGDLLLCSDGFSRFVPEERTLELVSESNDLQHCCESLIETAKRLGSDDNISCVLVRIVTA